MGKCEKWTIAYRARKNGLTLMEDQTSPFISVSNTWRYWRADPFLFEKDGKTYLFAELYDRLLLRGVLGCCVLSERGAGKWEIILDEPFHLSYPFVFQNGSDIYMIPESCRSGKIILYKAVSFPYRWERVRELADMVAVDSTVVEGPEGKFLLTYRSTDDGMELAVMEIDGDLTLRESYAASEKNDCNVRPAGNPFIHKGQLIRPAQDCSAGYGFGLNFMKVTQLNSNCYEELAVCKILPTDVNILNKKVLQGIHTYNLTDTYEVIDYKEFEFGFVSKVGGLLRRLRRLFGMK